MSDITAEIEKIPSGSVCAICLMSFIDEFNHEVSIGKKTICDVCSQIPNSNKLGYAKQPRSVTTTKLKGVEYPSTEDNWDTVGTLLDNDTQAFSLDKKFRRNSRKLAFDEKDLPLYINLIGDKLAWNEKQECYSFSLEQGKIEFYPKSDRLHIHAGNQWLSNGRNWLRKNILPQV